MGEAMAKVGLGAVMGTPILQTTALGPLNVILTPDALFVGEIGQLHHLLWMWSFRADLQAHLREVVTEVEGRLFGTAERWPCSVHGCERDAVEALCFRGQAGHVHVCARDGALDREHCDVIESSPLPCPYPHGDGTTWAAQPQELV